MVELTTKIIEEYQIICHNHRIKLRMPQFRITESHRTMGYWDATHRIIGLSKHLIQNRTWDYVQAVLRHEMAHQLVSEVFKVQDNHGQYFLQACKILGVPHEFQKASADEGALTDLPKWDVEKITLEVSSAQKRIQKLLALVEGSTEPHEKEVALLRLHEHFSRYGNQEENIHDNKASYRLRLRTGKKVSQSWITSLLNLMQLMSHVISIWLKEYNIKDKEDYVVIDIFGTAAQIQYAEYLWNFFHREVKNAWAEYVPTKGKKNSQAAFKLGVIQGYKSQFLEKQAKMEREKTKTERDQEKQALIVLEDNHLELRSYFYPSIHSTGGGRRISHKGMEAYQSGRKQGESIDVHRPISKNSSDNGQKFLS